MSYQILISIFNEFFGNTVSSLNIPAIYLFHSSSQDTGPILAIVDSNDKHPKIKRMKDR